MAGRGNYLKPQILQLQPATPRDAEPTTLFLLHPQTPSSVLGLVWVGLLFFFFAFNFNTATQEVLFSSGLETANKKREFTAIISVSCLVFSQSLLKQKNNFLGMKSEESFASK